MLSMLSLLGAVAMLVPPAALATSAGDQQYVDPLGGSGSGSSSGSPHSSSGSGSSSGSSSSGSSSSGSSSASGASSSGSAAASGTAIAAAGPATTNTTPSTTSTGSAGATLPFTGFEGWLSGGIGLVLLASGFALRRVTRQPQ
jgi:hypothetical protein